jgi:hypothetical protein
MHQLRVNLFQGGVIKTRSRISVSTMLLFQTRYVVSDLVIVGADPLRINSEWRINQERAKETTEQTTNFRSLAGMKRP